MLYFGKNILKFSPFRGLGAFVPAMVTTPHLSTVPVGRMLLVDYSHRAPFAPNYIGAHSPGAIAFRPFGANNTNVLLSALLQ
ncbi:MAG: hypothetical protein PF486_10450 [Prolixibacteraceae bacterium]|jgi:hypothetical protein|nr:hypothetical protein [Prolixibacteraceae bacterium]